MMPVYYESMPVDYSCDDELEASRDPTHYKIDGPDDPQPVDGWMLPLTYGRSRGTTLLLDAREGKQIQILFCRRFPGGSMQPLVSLFKPCCNKQLTF